MSEEPTLNSRIWYRIRNVGIGAFLEADGNTVTTVPKNSTLWQFLTNSQDENGDVTTYIMRARSHGMGKCLESTSQHTLPSFTACDDGALAWDVGGSDSMYTLAYISNNGPPTPDNPQLYVDSSKNLEFAYPSDPHGAGAQWELIYVGAILDPDWQTFPSAVVTASAQPTGQMPAPTSSTAQSTSSPQSSAMSSISGSITGSMTGIPTPSGSMQAPTPTPSSSHSSAAAVMALTPLLRGAFSLPLFVGGIFALVLL